MNKIGTNYKKILDLGKRYPSTRDKAEQATLLKLQGHNIKTLVMEIKEELEIILNTK